MRLTSFFLGLLFASTLPATAAARASSRQDQLVRLEVGQLARHHEIRDHADRLNARDLGRERHRAHHARLAAAKDQPAHLRASPETKLHRTRVCR